MRRLVEALIGRIVADAQPDLHRLNRVGLVLGLLQLLEDLGRLVGRGRPDEFEAGEGQGQEDEFGLQVGGVGGGGDGGGGGVVVGGEGVEGEGFGLVEFDEEHGVFVVLEHGFGLGEETPVFEGGDEVAYGFALDADRGR